MGDETGGAIGGGVVQVEVRGEQVEHSSNVHSMS